MSTPVSVEEAYAIIKEKRGFVTCGGYTLYNGGYFAMGTFPGCMRGGKNAVSLEDFKEFTERTRCLHWEHLTFYDVIRRCGYYPTSLGLWSQFSQWNFSTEEIQQLFGIELDMIKYMIDSDYKVHDFKDHDRSSKIWTTFLERYSGI